MKLKILILTTVVLAKAASSNAASIAIRSYNDQTIDHRQATIEMPSNLQELQSIVKEASLKNKKLKVAGASHSTSSVIIGEGDYISLQKMNKIGHIEKSDSGSTITIQAGVTLGQLSDYLDSKGYSLGFGFPAYRNMTVGGLVATGSHGSSRIHSAISSQSVVEMSLVKSDGSSVVVNEKGAAEFNAAKTSLGLLGVVYELKLKIEPQFNLEMKTIPLEGRHSLLSENGKVNWGPMTDYEAIAWFPHDDKAVKFSGSKSARPSMRGAENVTLGNRSHIDLVDYVAKYLLKWGRHVRFINQLTEYLRYQGLIKRPPFVWTSEKGDVNSDSIVGPSNKILLSREISLNRLYTQQDLSFSFPESEAFGVLNTIRGFSIEHNYRFPLVGVYFRFARSDGKSYLSHIERPGQAGELYVLAEFMDYKDYGVSRMPRLQHDELREKLLKLLIEKHHVSFHWGKNSNEVFLASNLKKVYGENLEKFNEVARSMDPQGMFQSHFTAKALRGIQSCQGFFQKM